MPTAALFTAFSVRAVVMPASMSYDAYPGLSAFTTP
jgi:hypothetical protein